MPLAVKTQERRQDLSHTIKALEVQRQNTLNAYHKLECLDTSNQIPGEPTNVSNATLQELLTQMVDYLAMGHITLYQRIVDGKERRANVNATSQLVYPSIGETTDSLVEFYDKYEYFDGDTITQRALKDDISMLGETLLIRCELEDELLTVLAE